MSTQKINDIVGFGRMNLDRINETLDEKRRLRDEARYKADAYQDAIDTLTPIAKVLEELFGSYEPHEPETVHEGDNDNG